MVADGIIDLYKIYSEMPTFLDLTGFINLSGFPLLQFIYTIYKLHR
jgi:hypothetical protein